MPCTNRSIYDSDFKFIFTKQSVVVYDPQQRPLIMGWREPNVPKLWRIELLLSPSNISTPPTGTTRASLQAFSAYELPSVEALVCYFHVSSGFPVRDNCIQAIKCGNYYYWIGITYTNVDKYCPSSEKTIMGHLVQSRQGLRSKNLNQIIVKPSLQL